MRRLLLCLLAAGATACAGRQALPAAPAWLNGQNIAVEGPVKVGVGGPELAAKALSESVRTDLQAAGFSVAASKGGDQLRLVLDTFERTSSGMVGGTLLRATLWRGERAVDKFDVAADQLGCVSPLWGVQAQQNADCFSRGLVSAVMRSEKVAAAAAGAPATPRPVAPPPAIAQQSAPAPRSELVASQTAPARTLPLRGKLAVLDLKNFTKDLTRQNAQYFTDVIRQASLKMEPGIDIMTRENLMVLLQSTGKKLEECEGECEVDTGRRIGADTIVSGEIQKVGTRYKLTLRLHDTHEGKLLSSSIGSGKSIDELDESAQKAAEDLFTLR
jgi:TolB-like protein